MITDFQAIKSATVKSKISPSISYIPLEETLEIIPKRKKLFIGIPKEDAYQENRIPLTPEAISILVQNGHEVVIEQNAGLRSHFSDNDYAEQGAQIVYDKESVFKAHVILKSAPITEHDINYLQNGQLVISPVHLPFLKSHILEQLIKKRIIAIAFDSIKDDSGAYPIVRSMSEIAGSSAITIASNYLSSAHHGRGILLGGVAGVPPARVVIIGAGMVAESATKTALGLGATVQVFDNSIYRLMRLQNNVGQRIYTSVINSKILEKELINADVAVGALKPVNGVTPVVVSEQIVSQMKAGSIIVDVSIDRGGCFETSRVTSHEHPVYTKHDVIHYCVPNIASGVPRTASKAISNVLMPILDEAAELGGFEALLQIKSGIRHGVYLYKGCVTNIAIAKRFNLNFTNIDLILSTII